MITKDTILEELNAGRPIDAICADIADAINEAKREYEADNKRRAMMKLAADKAAAAMNEYYKLRYPDTKFVELDGDLLGALSDIIMYGVDGPEVKDPATTEPAEDDDDFETAVEAFLKLFN